MNDNLREALTAKIDEWDTKYGTNSRAQEVFKEFGPQTVDIATVVKTFREILNDNPDESETEWAVFYWDSDNDVSYGLDERTANTLQEVRGGFIRKRRAAGPWERVK